MPVNITCAMDRRPFGRTEQHRQLLAAVRTQLAGQWLAIALPRQEFGNPRDVAIHHRFRGRDLVSKQRILLLEPGAQLGVGGGQILKPDGINLARPPQPRYVASYPSASLEGAKR